MNIFVSGINYKITSIDIREKLKLTKESGGGIKADNKIA